MSYAEVDGMNIHPAHVPENGDNVPTASIKVEGNAMFSWKHNVRIQKKGAPTKEDQEAEKKFSLKNINLQLQSGHLTMICGRVGSGKSSLVQAILGEMKCDSGSVKINGSIACVPNQRGY